MSATSQAVPDYLVLEEGLPFPEVERRIALAHADAGLRQRALAFYLHEVNVRGLHQLAGCRTTAQYAAVRFGISRREARDLVAIGGFLRAHPRIDAAFAAGQLCWSKVRELARVVVPEHEARWLERALALHIDELALEVKLRNPGEPPRKPDDRKGLPEIRIRVNTALPPDVFAKWQLARNKVQDESGRALREWEFVEALCDLALTTSPDGTPPGRVHGFESPYSVVVNADPGAATVDTEDGRIPVDDATAEMIACDAGCVDPARCDQEADRRIPPGLRRKLYARDGGRCRACGSQHRKHGHHIIPVSQGGLTRLDNLLTLCRACHSLAHADLLIITGDSVSGWRFLDPKGHDLHGPGATAAEAIGELAAEGTRLVAPPECVPAAVETGGDLCEFGKFGTLCQINTAPGLADLVGQAAVVEALAIAVELAELICRAAGGQGIAIDDAAAVALAQVARGTPREALRLLGRAGDDAMVSGREVIDAGVVVRTLSRLGIDGQGLGPVDRAYLERLHEPYIFRQGLATTTPNGRVAVGGASFVPRAESRRPRRPPRRRSAGARL
jgi:RuvB-like AAA lid domain-containing protein/HNH endonuclease